MSARSILAILVVVSCAVGLASRSEAQSASGDQYVGQWTGTYDGAGTGTMEVILDKKDGAIVGKLSANTDGGNYTADLKGIAFEGAKMSASYDYPLDPSAEIVLTATFDGSSAKGTWSLHPKGQKDELAGGGFAISKK